MFNFKIVREAMLEKTYVVVLAITHSILHHSGIGQMSTMTDYVKEKLKPLIKTEYQLIYLCHIMGPFLHRLNVERPRAVSEITAILYELLEQVDKNHGSAPLKYMDPICDLLYHLKYMFVGDIMKNELETIIRRLRPALQMRLRFITRLNVEEIGTDQQNPVASAEQAGASQNTANQSGPLSQSAQPSPHPQPVFYQGSS
jgi:mediator of RNA polymerase II transcription subunit 23